MRLVCISDTHNQLGKVKLPEGDVLLHAGDWTMKGTLTEVAQFAYDLRQVVDRFPLGAIVVAGNHDYLAEQDPFTTKTLLQHPKITYLCDNSTTINGLKVWGSPWQPWFLDWAFNLERGDEIKAKWDLIPEDTDILITHGPPVGIRDALEDGTNVGCEDLGEAIDRVSPRLHLFGHIHHSYGEAMIQRVGKSATRFVNASICTERYKPTNEPIVVEL